MIEKIRLVPRPVCCVKTSPKQQKPLTQDVQSKSAPGRLGAGAVPRLPA